MQATLDDPVSRIDRVKLAGKETVTSLAEVDDMIVYRTANGGMVLEFVRWGSNKKPLESFRVTCCPEDADRIKAA